MTAERFATYVATLGRGPGRSRALTRAEARDAAALLLAGAAAPEQVGAFLMLLRYRGEDAHEIAGLVEGFREAAVLPGVTADLDWPSYGAGRTRAAPWFLLAALALAGAGIRVLLHGSNEFSAAMPVGEALALLGLRPARHAEHAQALLAETGFAYVPVAVLCPRLAELLGLRRLLGLRSPLNTVARLLNPAGAPAGLDGVFHPPYIDTHIAVAELLRRRRLLVLKGGGGEAERNPARPVAVHLWDAAAGRSEIALPALEAAPMPDPAPPIDAVWRGAARDPAIIARITGTIALALLALERGGDREAAWIWRERPIANQL